MPTTGGMKTRCWRNARNLPQKSKPCAFAARILAHALSLSLFIPSIATSISVRFSSSSGVVFSPPIATAAFTRPAAPCHSRTRRLLSRCLSGRPTE